MPMERERYPADWEQIALGVKERAEWKCQNCGKQCRRPGEPFDTHTRTLTVAHLNHAPEDVRPENLMAMCAPCHLRYDAKHHAETRKNKQSNGLKGAGGVVMGKTVEKKILPEYYRAVRQREKTFELRKDEDDVQVGDILTLREWDGEKYTGRKITRIVTYVLRDCQQYGLMDGYCIIGIMPVCWEKPQCLAKCILD